MESIKVSTRRQDQTIHHAVLDGKQLEALVLEAVARAAGVTIDRHSVRVDRLYLTSRMGSTGSEFEATCTIIVDHQAAPAAVAPPPRRPRPRRLGGHRGGRGQSPGRQGPDTDMYRI